MTMETKDNKKAAKKAQNEKGSSKDKASFDQNGEGASEKFGQAGSKPNESGDGGPGTVNKNKEN
ncbi:hypothetical protein SAMN04488511_11935 [Pedobacter suwonensis]|uniref:Uncharacterized protein n=2 Tax=Pedobacter suwonensis TaxID=332999 RepID=A0A1I0U316_9SPHI|nr:hypothetical protein SAMN04488511_11935 [Pedobacter suwonensis]